MLVFAGAGSGKTRALTYRIAHMVRDCGIPPERILAVTFTNKAAGEMKERIGKLVGDQARRIWAGTFHSTCARILRADGEAIGVPSNFVIYDETDQRALIKQALGILDIDATQYKPQDIQFAISGAKNELMGPQEYRAGRRGPFDDIVRRVYSKYQQLLRENMALDFDDLLVRAVQLFKESPATLEKYQERFHYILVDEYQDINFAQYQFVKLLAAKRRNLCVVGDDDQSIYGWRGANVRIILDFQKDWPDATVVKLEQNYRSTQKILECAYEVIRRNRSRADKKLWTQNRPGDNLVQYEAVSAEEEAEWVAEAIETQVRCKLARYGDYAILYRANAMSRVFEEALMQRRIPYEIVGGIRFYERAIIKDFIAYLRVIHNPADSVSLSRIINTPTRGIGDKTVAVIHQIADANNCSMYESVRYCAVNENLSERARHAVGDFYDLIESLRHKAQRLGLTELCRAVAEDSGYLQALQRSGTAEDAAKAENLMEFVTLAQRFEQAQPDADLGAFLEHLALISDLDEAQDLDSKVCLMTLHAAKGLEFPIVFMVGMEEGIFPHQRSMGDEHELAEERRLCYVGITRAQRMLYLTHASRRVIYGQPQQQRPSRFLSDLPDGLVDRQVGMGSFLQSSLLDDEEEVEVEYGGRKINLTEILSRVKANAERAHARGKQEDARLREGRTSRAAELPTARVTDSERSGAGTVRTQKRAAKSAPATAELEFRPGDMVRHPTFGSGRVVQVKGSGADASVVVAFPDKGVKELSLAYARLQRQ